MKPRDQELLLQRFVDGDLDEGACLEVVALINSDPAIFDIYCDYAEIDAGMRYLTCGPANALGQQTALTEESRQNTLKRAKASALLAAAAAIVVLSAILYLRLVAEPPPVLTFRTSPDTRLAITHIIEGEKSPDPNTLAVGSRMMVKQGCVEFTFESGVSCIVQGPADLTLLEENSVRLDRGTSWFRVPKEAIGFEVRTPEMKVVDLGTEFGIISEPGESDEAHVMKGKIALTALLGRKEEALLESGQARTANFVGRLDKIEARPEAFLTELPSNLPSISISFDSRSGSRLAVTGTHPDAASIKARLISSKPASGVIPGVVGNAISLNGEGDWIKTDWPGFSGDTPRSVAFWFRIPQGAHSGTDFPAVVGWGSRENRSNGKWKIWLTRNHGDGELLPGISFGADDYYCETPVDDGHWHHLVAIFNGPALADGSPECSLYLNGNRKPLVHHFGPEGPPESREVQTVTTGPEAHPMSIGFGLSPKLPTLQADLDELQLFEGAIPEQTILEHYQRRSVR